MRTPPEHYAAATELLEQLTTTDNTLPIARVLVARAKVHATLAQCPDWYGDPDYDGTGNDYSSYVTMQRVETREPTGGRL